MALIDGIKCSCILNEKEYLTWKSLTSNIVRTWVSVYEDTGEIKIEECNGHKNWRIDKNGNYKWFTILHSAEFQNYEITIREKFYENLKSNEKRKSYRWELCGSITSNYHNGNNWQDLNFDQLQQELNKLESILKLDLGKVKIDNLEPSITFALPFNVFNFINKNLVSYGNQPFNRYGKNRNGKALGRFIELTDRTTVKAYDKAVEYDLQFNLMQFELHFKKMGTLNKVGINCLSDLKCWDKVNCLRSILITYFKRILIFDPDINPNDVRLNSIQKNMVIRGRSFEFWEDLKSECSNGTYYNRLNEFKSLSEKYGSNCFNQIMDTFLKKWDSLMETKKSCKILPTVKNEKLEEFPSTVGWNNIQSFLEEEMSEYLRNQKIKSKKQLAKEKRELDDNKIKSFLKVLSSTIPHLKYKS